MKIKGIFFILLFTFFLLPLQAKDVYLGGESIGIHLNYEGLLITSTYEVKTSETTYDPKKSDILSGDTILEADGKPIETLSNLNTILSSKSGQQVVLTLKRDNKRIYRNLTVLAEDDKIKSGLFVKDEIMGIGTLTYMDPQSNKFGSLGHEILDQDTKQLILLDSGILYPSRVQNISKAQISRVGEKQALIDFTKDIGTIDKVNSFGVFGKTSRQLGNHLISTALPQEVTVGLATMYTVLKDEKVEAVQIEITHVYPQSKPDIKSFEFIMTDQNILKYTNGIVQGMSGSPIVQNDKLIGAVTHVSASNPKQGFGVYIEWMLKESD